MESTSFKKWKNNIFFFSSIGSTTKGKEMQKNLKKKFLSKIIAVEDKNISYRIYLVAFVLFNGMQLL
jgi:hypothetical protein